MSSDCDGSSIILLIHCKKKWFPISRQLQKIHQNKGLLKIKDNERITGVSPFDPNYDYM